MKRPEAYTKSDRQVIAEALRSGGVPTCPLCHAPLDAWPVPPRQDVSYVRDRVWLVCGRCSRSVVLDRDERRG